MFGAAGGFPETPLNGQSDSDQGVSQREIGVQFQSPANRAHSIAGAAQTVEQVTLGKVCPRVAVVHGERSLNFRAYLGRERSQVARPCGAAQQRPGEQAVGLTIARGDYDGASAQSLGVNSRLVRTLSDSG